MVQFFVSHSPFPQASCVLFLLLLTCINGQANPSPHSTPCPVVLPTARIVGGTLIQSPYLVFLQTLRSSCSGTLITPTHVLTAAHCQITSSAKAFVSSTDGLDGTEISIVSNATHPTDDIAVVTLSRPANVETARLLTNPNLPTPWSFVRAQGYGLQSFFPFPSDSRQRFVDMPVIPSDLCEQLHNSTQDADGLPLTSNDAFPDRFVCTGYLESASCSFCQGDSGGPVFAFLNGNPIVVGVISRLSGCGLPDSPSMSVRITSNIAWLDDLGVAYNGVSTLSETFVDGKANQITKTETVQVGLSGGAIAGIVVGCVVAALAAVLVAVLVIQARRKATDPSGDGGERGQNMPSGVATLIPTGQSEVLPESGGLVPHQQLDNSALSQPLDRPAHPVYPVQPVMPAEQGQNVTI